MGTSGVRDMINIYCGQVSRNQFWCESIPHWISLIALLAIRFNPFSPEIGQAINQNDLKVFFRARNDHLFSGFTFL